MSDMISRSALLEHIDRKIQCIDIAPDPLYRIAWEIVRDWIAYDAPTVDTVPAVHGRWGKPIEYGLPYATNHLGVVCSYCCKWSDNDYNYCPNCGAKMDGGAE